MAIISRLLLPSIDLLLDTLKPGKDSLNLKDNQIIEAKVAKLLPQGKAELLINGRSVEASTQMPLSENETLYLKVVKEEGKTVLKLMEAYTPPKIQEGLQEMNTLGREGPYSSLAKIVNPLPETGNTGLENSLPDGEMSKSSFTVDKQMNIPQPIGEDFKTSSRGLVSPESGETLKTGNPAADLKPSQPGNPSPSDLDLLKTCVTDKKIPFELKLAALLTVKNQSESQIPDEIIKNLSVKLLESLPQTLISQSQSGSAKPITGSPSLLKPLEVAGELDKAVRERLESLPQEERAAIIQLTENKSLTWNEKILPLLMTQKPEIMDAKELKPLLYMLKPTMKENPAEGSETTVMPGKTDVSGGLVSQTDKDTLPVKTTFHPNTSPERVFQHSQAGEHVETPLIETSPIVKKIKDLLHTLSIKPEEPFDGKNLKTMVRDSGLMWENKLREFVEAVRGKDGPVIETMVKDLIDNDVKALAMKGVEKGEAVSPKIAENLKSFVDNLDKMQMLNSHTSDDSGQFLLPLPYFSGETLKFGQIMIDLDRKKETEGKNGDRIVRVAFILEMTNLGHVQADVSVFRKSLTGEFVVENSDVKSLIEEAVPELSEELTRKGFALRKLTVRLEAPGTLAHTALTERLVKKDNHQVSILI